MYITKILLLMGRSFLLIFSILFFTAIQAQILRKPVAATYTGLGAYSLNHIDAFSFSTNQAALAQVKGLSAGLYGERRFMLEERSNYSAIVAMPTKSGNFALKANYAGFTDFNETQFGLAYGRKLGAKLDIGAQFNYNSILISNYGSSSAISFELGTIFHLTEKLHTGLHVSNPVAGKFGKDQSEKLSSVYSVGVGYDASTNFLISAEVQKEEDQPVNVNAGFQYKIASQLLVRAGMSSATSTIWAGAGLSLKSLRLDLVAGYHPQLGVTPGIMLLFIGKYKASQPE
jgi:hypothetical protein